MHNSNESIVITIGNTKGGCGKSTIAVLISHYLSLKSDWQKSQGLKEEKICIIDFDTPQSTSETFFQNRLKNFGGKAITPIRISYDMNNIYFKKEEFKQYLNTLKEDYHYILIDSGGHHDEVTQLSIECADVLVTPVINTIIDLNVLFNYNSDNGEITEGSYTKFVRASRDKKKKLAWFVIPNRCSPIITEYSKKCLNILNAMSNLIGFKVTGTVSDRAVYSQGFDMGITCFDNNLEMYFPINNMSTINAKKEISNIVKFITQ
jgi:chromosome partitioning protein